MLIGFSICKVGIQNVLNGASLGRSQNGDSSSLQTLKQITQNGYFRLQSRHNNFLRGLSGELNPRYH